ncbi:MAG TPA: hypothetical protein VLB00_02275 [Gemmatimonadales bacterium]|nr:hypothetical protein [Gemmatimonadales bacterium]
MRQGFHGNPRVAGLSAAGVLFGLFAAGPVSAQAVTARDSVARVITLSSPEELRRLAGQTAADDQAARQLMDRARQEERRVQALVEMQKVEISTVNKRMDLANKEKRESDRKAMEQERKLLELRLRMLERWKDVQEVTVQVAERSRELAQQHRKAIDAELQLLEVRERADRPDRSALADSAVRAFEMGRVDEDMIQQLRRVLEARRAESEARRQLAERQRDLAEKLLALLEAQLALRAGKT